MHLYRNTGKDKQRSRARSKDLNLGRRQGKSGQRTKSGLRFGFSGEQVTLDAPDEEVARVVVSEDLEMRIETVTIHFNVEAASITLRTILYLSAVYSRSQGKN